MGIFELIKFAPKLAIFLLPFILAVIAFAILNFFKKKKGQPQVAVSPLASAEPLNPPREGISENLFLVLATFFLLLSLPVAIILIKQRQEIRMRAKEEDRLTPTLTSSSLQGERIKIYDENWVEIPYEALSFLTPGQIIRIAVSGGKEGNFDKGRIRINSMEWSAENETSSQKPDSPGEFYIECEVGVGDEKATICGISAISENEFKIEAEIHDTLTGEWQ